MQTTEYDYTQDDAATADGSDDFSFGGVSYDKTADQIESERARRDVPPGEHEFFVSGFLALPPKSSLKQGYVDGKAVSYNAYDLGVRLSMVGDPAASVIDFFHLPSHGEHDKRCFMKASKKPDGKNAGFMAEKLGVFLDRLGFNMPKGAPIPAEAQNIKNWKGRKIVATIELQEQKDSLGNPRVNPSTGEPYPPKASVKLFTYRPHSSTLGGASHPSQIRPSQPAQAGRPVPPPPPPIVVQSGGSGRPGITEDKLARLRGAL